MIHLNFSSIFIFLFVFLGVFTFAQQDDLVVARGNFGSRWNPKLTAIQQAPSAFRRRGERLVRFDRNVGGEDDVNGSSGSGGIMGHMGSYLSKILYGDSNASPRESIAAKLRLGADVRDGARGFRSEVRRIDNHAVVESRGLRMGHGGAYEFQYQSPDGTEVQEVGRESGSGGAVKSGSYSYVGDDGHTYSLSYEAGKDGFRPIGAHLPQEKMAPKALGIFPRLEQAWNDRLAEERTRKHFQSSGRIFKQGRVNDPLKLDRTSTSSVDPLAEIERIQKIEEVDVEDVVATDSLAPTLDADDEAAYLMFLADMEDLPKKQVKEKELEVQEEKATLVELAGNGGLVADEVQSQETTTMEAEDERPETTTTMEAEDGVQMETTTAAPHLDADDETSVLLFLADMLSNDDEDSEDLLSNDGEDSEEPRGPKEILTTVEDEISRSEEELDDVILLSEEQPENEHLEEAELIHNEDMALMHIAGHLGDIAGAITANLPSPETSSLNMVDVEAATDAVVPTLNSDDEALFLSFLEDMENFPSRKQKEKAGPMHNDDMALMFLAGADVPTRETTTLNAAEMEDTTVEMEDTTDVPAEANTVNVEEIEETTVRPAEDASASTETTSAETTSTETTPTETTRTETDPSLDHNDESAFLMFLADHDDLPTKEEEVSSTVPNETEPTEDVFAVEVFEDSPVEEGNVDIGEQDTDDDSENPKFITDYFDLSEEDDSEGRDSVGAVERNPEVESRDDAIIDEEDDNKVRPDRGVIFDELLKDLAEGVENHLGRNGVGMINSNTFVNRKVNQVIKEDDGDYDDEDQLYEAEAAVADEDDLNSILYEDFTDGLQVEEEEEEEDGFPVFENFPKNKSNVGETEESDDSKVEDESHLATKGQEVEESHEVVEAEVSVPSEEVTEDDDDDDDDDDDEPTNEPKLVAEDEEEENKMKSRGPKEISEEEQRNAALILPSGAKGENRASPGMSKIINEFRTEGQIRDPDNLPSVSEMKYTVSITDVDGSRVEVQTTGSGIRSLGDSVEYIGVGNQENFFDGRQSGALVKDDRDRERSRVTNNGRRFNGARRGRRKGKQNRDRGNGRRTNSRSGRNNSGRRRRPRRLGRPSGRRSNTRRS